MFRSYCIIALFIVFLLYHCMFCCILLWHKYRPRLLYIFSNSAVQLQVCYNKVELLSWVYMDYWMAQLPVNISDLEGHFWRLKPLYLVYQRVISVICLHMNRQVHMVCNFNFLFKNEGLLKVLASHVHCKCANISETSDRIVVTTNHKQEVIYGLSNKGNPDDLETPSRSFPTASLLNVIFLQLFSGWPDFIWHSVSRSTFAVAEHCDFLSCSVNPHVCPVIPIISITDASHHCFFW